jgi:hypothetical protein
MNRLFLKKHVLFISIMLFLITFYIIHHIKPSFLYKKNGNLRAFGIGYKEKTIIPLWLISIILPILCYIVIRYYLEVL